MVIAAIIESRQNLLHQEIISIQSHCRHCTIGLALNYDQGPFESALVYQKTYDATGNDSARKTLLGANYNFGPVKTHGSYQFNKGTGRVDYRVWLLGVTVPLGQFAIVGDYTHLSDRAISNGDSKQIAVGVTYDLSKRTNLYTSYSHAAKYNVIANGATDKFFNVGVRHKFQVVALTLLHARHLRGAR